MKRRTSVARTSVRAEVAVLRRELHDVRAVAAEALDAIKRDCATNLRRCGELQNEIDGLRKILEPLISARASRDWDSRPTLNFQFAAAALSS